MNVDPLSSLSEEEMRQLLLKRKAEKAAMPTQYGFVDESVGIPKGRFNPGQYAPTYGAEQVGLPANFYGKLSPPGIDKKWDPIAEAGEGSLQPWNILKTAFNTKLAEGRAGVIRRNIMQPDVNIPEVGTSMVGYRSQELA